MQIARVEDFSKPAKPIAEVASREDFPEAAVGEHIDFGGFTGVITSIVQNSIKVRLSEGQTRSFNYHTLRKIHAPRVELPPTPEPPREPEPPPLPREEHEIAEPNFDSPPKPITEFLTRPDFPKVAYGEHVDVGGFAGVVVHVKAPSLKIRSREGISRKYNADILKKVHGVPGAK